MTELSYMEMQLENTRTLVAAKQAADDALNSERDILAVFLVIAYQAEDGVAGHVEVESLMSGSGAALQDCIPEAIERLFAKHDEERDDA